MISTCSEFGVSNLRSAIRVWPLNTSVQHRSPVSHLSFLSVIYKVSDLVGRCDHAFTQWYWRLMHWDERLPALRKWEVNITWWGLESSTLEAGIGRAKRCSKPRVHHSYHAQSYLGLVNWWLWCLTWLLICLGTMLTPGLPGSNHLITEWQSCRFLPP